MGVFRFKGFSVRDDNSPMKVGADSVILGSWVDIYSTKSVLDVGSGCGLLSLMLAYRNNDLVITGVEINGNSLNDSLLNLASFNIPNQIKFVGIDFINFEPEHKFELIISNPPYFSPTFLSPSVERNLARIQVKLDLELLFAKSIQLLASNGRLAIVYPFHQLDMAIEKAIKSGLKLQQKLIVRHKPASKPKRVFLVFGVNSSDIISSEMSICDDNGDFTQEYRNLTKDFYLDF